MLAPSCTQVGPSWPKLAQVGLGWSQVGPSCRFSAPLLPSLLLLLSLAFFRCPTLQLLSLVFLLALALLRSPTLQLPQLLFLPQFFLSPLARHCFSQPLLCFFPPLVPNRR